MAMRVYHKRKLEDVIEAMLAKIPADQQSFRLKLNSIRRSLNYCAPEQLGFWWHETGNALVDELGVPHKAVEWKTQVTAIWMDEV